MRDVAALAGVSIKTVSRVVNLEPHTRPEVVLKVRSAITELGWTPNGSARTLRTGRTSVISLALPELQRPAIAMLTEALVEELARRGLQAAIEPTHNDPQRLRRLLSARSRLFDAIIIIGPPPPDVLDSLSAATPVVVVQSGLDLPIDRVDCDAIEAAALIARHLVLMGRSRPSLLGSDRGDVWSRGMTSALVSAGITHEPHVQQGLVDRADGFGAVLRMLQTQPMPDSLVCQSDEIALGALRALQSQGVGVPEEVAVIGHDNLDDGQFTTPSLTTIDPMVTGIARLAVDVAADRIAGSGPSGPTAHITPVNLLRRESTLGPGAGL